VDVQTAGVQSAGGPGRARSPDMSPGRGSPGRGSPGRGSPDARWPELIPARTVSGAAPLTAYRRALFLAAALIVTAAGAGPVVAPPVAPRSGLAWPDTGAPFLPLPRLWRRRARGCGCAAHPAATLGWQRPHNGASVCGAPLRRQRYPPPDSAAAQPCTQRATGPSAAPKAPGTGSHPASPRG
jgi:hypothetical protein